MVIVFAGCLDQDEDGGLGLGLEEFRPQAEMWIKYRPRWVGEVKGEGEGVRQCAGFME